jgi:hypothetical protein
MNLSRNLALALALPLLPLTIACQTELDPAPQGDETLAKTSSALVVCPEPALNHTSVCDLGDGGLRFLVTLPTHQQYVEVFARQNGIQNAAVNITQSAHVHFDGSTTYSYARGGYQEGDQVQYRFYSYLPASPGVFTPGPQEQVWVSYSYDAAPAPLELDVTKDASLIYSSYGTGPSANRNFGSAPTVDVAGYHHDSRGLFGYDISQLDDTLLVNKVELVIPKMWAPGGNPGRFSLAKVNDSTSWQENTVTWLTTPASTLFGEFAVDASLENRLDVTALVKQAVANGEGEISFLLEDIQNNLFIDSKEKVDGQATYLSVQYSDVSWANLNRHWHVHPQGSGGGVHQLVPIESPIPGGGFNEELTFDAQGNFKKRLIAINGSIHTFGGSYTRTGNKLKAWFYEPFRKQTWTYEYEVLELTPSSLRLRELSFVVTK